MKKVHCWLIGLFLIFGIGSVYADVATEGEVDVYVQLMNGKDFPSFEFFIKYQGYYYEMGWQEGSISYVTLDSGKVQSTGGRGDASLLYARDTAGNEYASVQQIGGTAMDFDPKVSHYVDEIEIVCVRDGVVKFKVVARKTIGENDKVLKIKKGEISEFSWPMVAMPIACLLGLAAFFLFRRKHQA